MTSETSRSLSPSPPLCDLSRTVTPSRPKVDVGVMVRGVGQPADRVHQRDARRERPRTKVRARVVPHNPPVGLVEPPRCDRLAHSPPPGDAGGQLPTVGSRRQRGGSHRRAPSVWRPAVESDTLRFPLRGLDAKRAQARLLSRCCRRSWAASSTSLCRHSAARYWQAIKPVRCTRRKSP
jgi:hypothetical protein